MLLDKLVEYSQRLDALPPTLYAEAPVRYWISLDAQGGLLGMSDTADLSDRSTKRGRRRPVPQVQRGSNIRPLLLADRADYTLGVVPAGRDEEWVRERHDAYRVLVAWCARETESYGVQAVAKFLQSDPLSALRGGGYLDDTFDPSAIISFCVGEQEEVPIDVVAVQRFWASLNEDADARVLQCVVCRNHRPAMERLQARIKGIPGGQSSGTALISANSASFESYGLKASHTSPICAQCAEGFTRGLNALLSSDQSRFRLGESAFVHWTRGDEFDPTSMLQDPDPAEVAALFRSVRTGEFSGADDRPFYGLSLSASGGRAVVRDWMDTTIGRVQEALTLWFDRQRIASWSEAPPKFYGLRALAFATVREPRDLPVTTPQALLRAAFTGSPLPMNILARAVMRNRADRGVRRARVALIKMVLLSQDPNHHEEDYMVSLDTGHDDPAYLCGRLLAVLEQAQRGAIPNINATIVDRFYGTASAAPLTVFPRLMSGVRGHLRKLRRDRRGAFYALEGKIEEILGQIPATGYPRSLTLQEQGVFSLGFYHQRAHDNEQRREARARRQAAQEPDTEAQEET